MEEKQQRNKHGDDSVSSTKLNAAVKATLQHSTWSSRNNSYLRLKDCEAICPAYRPRYSRLRGSFNFYAWVHIDVKVFQYPFLNETSFITYCNWSQRYTLRKGTPTDFRGWGTNWPNNGYNEIDHELLKRWAPRLWYYLRRQYLFSGLQMACIMLPLSRPESERMENYWNHGDKTTVAANKKGNEELSKAKIGENEGHY